VLREADSLLMKVGVIMMALALALVIAAVVSITVGSEPTSGTESLVDYWQQH
jgi:TRAP-type C4-dicarboxylate transport system permease small subunit